MLMVDTGSAQHARNMTQFQETVPLDNFLDYQDVTTSDKIRVTLPDAVGTRVRIIARRHRPF
jgi:hypothetical protein